MAREPEPYITTASLEAVHRALCEHGGLARASDKIVDPVQRSRVREWCVDVLRDVLAEQILQRMRSEARAR